MTVFRLVTEKNLEQRASEASILTSLTQESTQDYIRKHNLRFTSSFIERDFDQQVRAFRLRLLDQQATLAYLT